MSLYRSPDLSRLSTEKCLLKIVNSCPASLHLGMWFQRGRVLNYQPIRNKNCLWRLYLLSHPDAMMELCKGPSIYASCKVWFHLAKCFQKRRFFKYQPIRNKNCPWQPCLLSNRDAMKKLCKRPPIDASYIVWFHLAEWFQRRRFLRLQPIRNKNCLWRPYLYSDQDEMRKL